MGLKKSLTEIGTLGGAKKARIGQRHSTMAWQRTLENNSPVVSKVPSPGQPSVKGTPNTLAVAVEVCSGIPHNRTSIFMNLDDGQPLTKPCKKISIFCKFFIFFSPQQLKYLFSGQKRVCQGRAEQNCDKSDKTQMEDENR